MSHSTPSLPMFNVGKVLSDAFVVYRGAFVPVFIIYAAVGLVGLAIVYAVGLNSVETLGYADMSFSDVILFILSAVLNNVAVGASILIAFSWGHGRPISVSGALSGALSKVHYLIIITFIWGFAVALASMALLVPGIWLIGVWAVILPCIMIEGHGISSLGRSAQLTKSYRWPVIGAFVVMIIIVFVLSIVISFIADLISPSTLIQNVLQTLLNAAINGLFMAIIVSIYQRLVEIKEGGNNIGVADVFE